ncbi:MAG: PucR family transcriptional regulator ligand-binding domain-containing protein [Clostridia bacterium]|nr:PucR family transcriptional regulator ligand-binding domain-containing protein [Clostridia bacterium]
MSITLKKLCSDTETKYSLKLIAGKSGLENAVRWVHMVEDRQVPDFLHGGELVFTTGIGHIGKDPLLEFVKRLKLHGAAGVVINIGPYLQSISDDVLMFCNKEGFPLFTLPWNIYIIDITYDFCRRIIENEKLETTAAECFKDVILNPNGSEKCLSFLEQHGFGRAVEYRVLSIKFLVGGENVTEKFEQRNHIKLWNILAKSKNYPSAMFVLNNNLIVIRQDMDNKAAKTLAETMDAICENKSISYIMGISDTKRGYRAVPKLLSEAEAAQKFATVNAKSSAFYKDIGINKIIFGVNDKEILENFADRNLKEIFDYDKKYKTDYAKILYCYLLCDCSVMSVAEQYGLHRNTVNSKIKAIKEIFNIKLTGSKKMELLLAYTIKNNFDKLGGGD